MTQMLASVANMQEALIALHANVDIIDLKNPAEGALGALPLSVISEVVAAIQNHVITSATIGDLPMEPALLIKAVNNTAATGVDIVKIGFFKGGEVRACIRALKPIAQSGVRLVAVLFADEDPDFEVLPEIEHAGFYGVMLDTARKNGFGLLDYAGIEKLQQFVELAHKYNLKSGLAGSLQLEQLSEVLNTKPDYLGLRGALCTDSKRGLTLDTTRVFALRQKIAMSEL